MKLSALALFPAFLGAMCQEASPWPNQIISNRTQNIIESHDELPEDMEPNTGDKYPANQVRFKVAASVTFADDADVLGLKLVNNHVTRARFEFMNAEESETLTVRMLGGSLWPLDADVRSGTSAAVRNLTTLTFNVDIPPQANISLEYPFVTELHPQDLRLLLAAVVESKTAGVQFQVDGYNGEVQVVDPPVSLFDPQILFLYALLTALFAGTCYFIYATWVKTLFPQHAKKSRKTTRRAAPKEQAVDGNVSSDGATGAATGSSFDSSWIQQHHLQRPEAKRARSGTPKTKAK